MTQYNAVGFRDLYIAIADSSTGRAVGGDTGSAYGTPANGGSADPIRWNGAFSMPTAIPSPNTLNIEGDDGVVAVYQFPANELPTGTLEMSSEDMDLDAVAQGTNTVTLGAFVLGLKNPVDVAFTQLFFIVHKRAKTVPGGLARYKTEVFRGSLTPLGQASSSQGDDKFTYAVAYDRMTEYPWGVSMVDGTEGTTGAGSFGGYSTYLWNLSLAQGDATALTIDLMNAPYEDSADAALVWVNGTLQTYSTNYTVDTGNAQITFQAGSEPAAGADIVVWYGYSA